MTVSDNAALLADLAEVIKVGLVVTRKHAKRPTPWLYETLSLRTFTPQGTFDESQLDSLFLQEEIKESFLTRVGDVIVRNAMPYIAITITPQTEGLLIPSNFIIVRNFDTTRITPEYCAWCINTPEAQNLLYRDANGHAFAPITVQQFKKMEIILPPMEKQRQLMEFIALTQKERELMQELAKKKEELYKAIVSQIIQPINKEKKK